MQGQQESPNDSIPTFDLQQGGSSTPLRKEYYESYLAQLGKETPTKSLERTKKGSKKNSKGSKKDAKGSKKDNKGSKKKDSKGSKKDDKGSKKDSKKKGGKKTKTAAK